MLAVLDDDVADDLLRAVVEEMAGVGTGDLETVEHGRCELGIDAVLRHRGDDHGEGDLDGFAVFERRTVESERGGGGGEVLGEDGVALGAVAGGDGVDDGGFFILGWAEVGWWQATLMWW